MIRTRRTCVIRLVTAVAIGRHRRVVVTQVATGTCHRDVRSGQRKTGVVVIERRRRPSSGAMTDVAQLRESRADVVGIVRSLEVVQVTSDARRAGQVIGTGRAVGSVVALIALQRGVCPGQRPAGGGVIEAGRRPGGGAVTDFALLREACGHVIGIVGSFVIVQVASDAGRALQVVGPRRTVGRVVTLVTLKGAVSSG